MALRSPMTWNDWCELQGSAGNFIASEMQSLVKTCGADRHNHKRMMVVAEPEPLCHVLSLTAQGCCPPPPPQHTHSKGTSEVSAVHAAAADCIAMLAVAPHLTSSRPRLPYASQAQRKLHGYQEAIRMQPAVYS